MFAETEYLTSSNFQKYWHISKVFSFVGNVFEFDVYSVTKIYKQKAFASNVANTMSCRDLLQFFIQPFTPKEANSGETKPY